jgi:hypothetical protein
MNYDFQRIYFNNVGHFFWTCSRLLESVFVGEFQTAEAYLSSM